MKRFLGLVCVLLLPVQAFAEGFYLMPEFGRGTIEFDADATIDGVEESENSATASMVIGYKSSSNIVAGGTIGTTNSETFVGLDNYQIYEAGPFIGYSIDITKNFHIVPMIGLNFWELDVEEGQFLNPGPEESRETNGTDSYWRVNFEFATEGLIDFNFSVVSGSYDFGTFYSGRFGMRFKF